MGPRPSLKRSVARWWAAALGLSLVVPLLVLGDTGPAQAADGHGDGRQLQLAVAADGFNTAKTGKVDIVRSTKYPGTVRFERNGGKQCLATLDGKNDTRLHFVQWTGCNGHSSKNWVLEPSHTAATPDPAGVTVEDDTLAALNTAATGEQPRFLIRNYRYPKDCLFSTGNGLNGAGQLDGFVATRGVAPDCGEPNSTGHKILPAHMEFAIMNDTADLVEWEFLRSQMRVGAIAMYERGLDRAFSGENLWVKPMSIDGEYVGLASKATTDGYFLPQAVEIDPVKEQAVVARTSSSQGCLDSNWWWGLDNTRGETPFTQDVKVGQQKTDEFGWSLGLEAGIEGEGSLAFFKGKYSVKVSGGIHKSWSTSKTVERSISLTAPAGLWGMAIVTTPSVTTLGTWKTGTALKRPWRFGGASTVALKDNRGEPSGTSIAQVNSHERKSCRALAETMLPTGFTPKVVLPADRIAPQVGDTLSSVAPFVDPQNGNALDVRYQWYADDKAISNQTLPTLEVTPSMLGKQLSFSTYENGGSMRFESQKYLSEQTAAVQAAGGETVDIPVALGEGIAGRSLELPLTGLEGLTGRLTIDAAQLPEGMSFDADSGTLLGAPAIPGHYALTVTDEAGAEIETTLTVDPEPTLFANAAALTTTIGSAIDVPLVAQAGTDAAYSVEYFDLAGAPADVPDGIYAEVTAEGATVLRGTPSETGDWLVRITEQSPHHDAGDSRETVHEMQLSLVPVAEVVPEDVQAPTISLDRVADEGSGASDLRVGDTASWQAVSTEADELTAVVHRAGDTDPVSWAEAVRTRADEIEIDAELTEPGDYVITVTATNVAGTTVRDFPFSVQAEADGDPSGDAGGADNGAASGSSDGRQAAAGEASDAGSRLASTGSAQGPLLGILAAGAAALLGAWLLVRRRNGAPTPPTS